MNKLRIDNFSRTSMCKTRKNYLLVGCALFLFSILLYRKRDTFFFFKLSEIPILLNS